MLCYFVAQSSVSHILKAIGVSPDPQHGFALTDCNATSSLPTITFIVSGTNITLSPKQYIIEATDGTDMVCVVGFNGLDIPTRDGPLWWVWKTCILLLSGMWERTFQKRTSVTDQFYMLAGFLVTYSWVHIIQYLIMGMREWDLHQQSSLLCWPAGWVVDWFKSLRTNTRTQSSKTGRVVYK